MAVSRKSCFSVCSSHGSLDRVHSQDCKWTRNQSLCVTTPLSQSAGLGKLQGPQLMLTNCLLVESQNFQILASSALSFGLAALQECVLGAWQLAAGSTRSSRLHQQTEPGSNTHLGTGTRPQELASAF